ncbi:hypothetical protein BC2230_10523 [Burkholderia cepacia]
MEFGSHRGACRWVVCAMGARGPDGLSHRCTGGVTCFGDPEQAVRFAPFPRKSRVATFCGDDVGHPGRARECADFPPVAEQQTTRMQRAVHVVGNGFAQIAQRAAFDVDEAVSIVMGQRGPQLRRADRLTGAADQAQAGVESPAIQRRREALALRRAAQPRVRRAQVAVGATRDFGQAIEHRIAGELARGRILDVQEVFAVGLAVADDQAGAAERDGRQAVQAMARLVQACVERVEFIVDVVLGMLYVDAHGKRRPSRAVRESGSSQEGRGMGAAPGLGEASRGRESAGDVLETGGDRGEARDAECEQDQDFVNHVSLLMNARRRWAVPRRR